MGFFVRDLLKLDILRDIRLLSGERGLCNEITGITITEAPDIAKFINGGEILLTSLYPFNSCTQSEYSDYIEALCLKASAVIFKKGRDVQFVDERIAILIEMSNKYGVPVVEIPFEHAYKDIMYPVMERLFNDEVTRLKYFKETHDKFMSLCVSMQSAENGYENILNSLSELIGNPIALYDKNMLCVASTDNNTEKLRISGDAGRHGPKLYSKYTYLSQLADCKGETHRQYIIPLNIVLNSNMYLVITETGGEVGSLDYIAIENAATALLLEFTKQRSIMETEKKFKSDIIGEIINGKITSQQKLHISANMLGLSVDACYRAIVFSLQSADRLKQFGFNEQIEYNNMLYEAIIIYFRNVNIQNFSIVVIQEVDPNQKDCEYLEETKIVVKKAQKSLLRNGGMIVNAGIGGVAEGLMNISKSFKEANDALLLVDAINGGGSGEPRVVMFSELGIFRLLSQFDDPSVLKEFIPEALKKLLAYKKPQGEELLTTLGAYLNNSQNVAKTAQELFVHYKTILYRINKIVSITGLDLSNSSDVLSIQVGLIILKLIYNYEKSNL